MIKTLLLAVVVGFSTLFLVPPTEARAQGGFHYRNGNIHIDIGDPHRRHGYGYYPRYPHSRYDSYRYYGHRPYGYYPYYGRRPYGYYR